MFFGSYSLNIDEKGRIIIPSKMRANLGEKLYIVRGFEGCASVYKEEDFLKYVEKIEKLPYETKKVRSFLRSLLESVVELTIDKQWRVLIPAKTLEKYSLADRVMIIGQLDHLEIWNPEIYENYKMESAEEFEKVAESIFAPDEK